MELPIKSFVFLTAATIIGATVHIDKAEMCDKEDYSVVWNIKLKDDGDKQIVEEASIDSKIDLNNDVWHKVTVYQREGDKWNLILSKKEGVCDLKENFVGEFIKGLENSAGIKQTCPYPKGKYQIKNYPLDFSKFKYKGFPPGTIKIKNEYFTKGDETKLLSCFNIEFTSKP